MFFPKASAMEKGAKTEKWRRIVHFETLEDFTTFGVFLIRRHNG
jgi:hypothetical protein